MPGYPMSFMCKIHIKNLCVIYLFSYCGFHIHIGKISVLFTYKNNSTQFSCGFWCRKCCRITWKNSDELFCKYFQRKNVWTQRMGCQSLALEGVLPSEIFMTHWQDKPWISHGSHLREPPISWTWSPYPPSSQNRELAMHMHLSINFTMS